jgi:hypothetical protein
MVSDRPRPPRALRERVFARSGGVCQRPDCGTVITLETFHVAHLRAHASGGPLHESNLEAWCAPCNLTVGARNAGDTRLRPRQWQLDALDQVITTIARTGASTVSAAPGAGKTVFAGLVFEALYEAGLVDRMLVLVPRRGLANQWSDELAAKRHVQLKPHSAIERAGSTAPPSPTSRWATGISLRPTGSRSSAAGPCWYSMRSTTSGTGPTA